MFFKKTKFTLSKSICFHFKTTIKQMLGFSQTHHGWFGHFVWVWNVNRGQSMRPRLLDATAFFGIYFVSAWKRNIGHGKIKGKTRGRVFPKKTDTKNPAKYAATCFLKRHAPKHETACFLVKQMTKKSSHVFQGTEWEWRYNTTSTFFASFLQLSNMDGYVFCKLVF